MSDNKHINNLATEIVKKEGRITNMDEEIVRAKKHLQFFIDRQAREEKEIADLKKQQEDLKNHKPGQLAKVSLYEFVNDWVRPEISFKIFSYLSDPHTEGINKVRTHRRAFRRSHRGKMRWEENRFYERSRVDMYNYQLPYCELPLYKQISSPFFKSVTTVSGRRDVRCAQYTSMSQNWVDRYERRLPGQGSAKLLSLEKYRNTNPLLHELWKLHQTTYAGNGNKKFVIKKGDIKKYLTLNKVVRRTELTWSDKCSEKHGVDESYSYYLNNHIWRPPQARQDVVAALMKI